MILDSLIKYYNIRTKEYGITKLIIKYVIVQIYPEYDKNTFINLPPDLLTPYYEVYKSEIDWEDISCEQTLGELFIEKFKDKLLRLLIKYYNIRTKEYGITDLIIEYGLVQIYSKYDEDTFINLLPDLLDFYYEEHKDKIDWENISCQKLGEHFKEKFQDKINWSNISLNDDLSEIFIERFQNKVNWSYVAKYQKLSESFIKKFQDKVNWYSISEDKKLSARFIENFKDKVDWCSISED